MCRYNDRGSDGSKVTVRRPVAKNDRPQSKPMLIPSSRPLFTAFTTLGAAIKITRVSNDT